MTTVKLDSDLCKQLAKHVETLTTSGKNELDTDTLKQLKKICRTADEYVQHTYHLLIYQLETEHAEIRLSALQVCDELFRRSHHFRELLVSDFQVFLELTVETDPEEPLPPPVSIAKKLKRHALDTIEQWYRTYGEAYKKLALGYNFLKDCKKVDFRDVHVRNEAERQRDEEQRIRRENANKEILEKHTREMSILKLEIDNSLEQMHECFHLLLPTSLQLFSDVDFKHSQPSSSKDTMEPIKDEEGNEKNWARDHGLVGASYNLTVQVQHENLNVKVTKDNESIMENLRDLKCLVMNRYLPAVAKWMQAIVKGSGPSDQLKKAVDLKKALDDAVNRCKEFGVGDEKRKTVEAPSDDEDDFEEVEQKEGYEPTIPQHLRSEYGLEPLSSKESSSLSQVMTRKDWNLSMPSTSKDRHFDELNDPTSMVANTKRLEEALNRTDFELPSTSGSQINVDKRKVELMAKAPKLRFDADLYNWGEETTEDASRVIKLDSLHRFWTPFNQDGSEFLRKEDAASRHNRIIEFSGEFKPVEWHCRAPLPSGRLCPRQDRHKCPLHGPIIARDVMGNPTNPEDRERLQQEEENRQRENPDWQDPKLLAEIKAATGMDLTIKKRGKKSKGTATKKKQKYPGLTDLKAKQSTSRTRLEKKVLNSESVKRVAATLDALDYKKYTDKYANQFNYAVQT